ncbi:LamB/YcsF family protein, partial [Staphylococcus epidermidis]|uniref:LamB/YcsF family protein n=1 Tax=Staphylococcus epidermidis TaxID=1282 RepID=UPI0016433FAB
YHPPHQDLMNETLQLPKKNNITIPPHPALPHFKPFPPPKIHLTPNQIYNLLIYQLPTLSPFSKINHLKIIHVKPHRPLYQMAPTNKEIA